MVLVGQVELHLGALVARAVREDQEGVVALLDDGEEGVGRAR